MAFCSFYSDYADIPQYQIGQIFNRVINGMAGQNCALPFV